MLEDALGSRSKVRILRELVRRSGEELTTEDLVRATGQSTGTLVPALQALAAAGVVTTRLVGRTRVFQLASRHPGTPILQRAFVDEAAALQHVADLSHRQARAPGIRYVAWYHDAEEGDDRRHAAWLLVVADDPVAAEAAYRRAMENVVALRLRVVGVEEAKKRLAEGDSALVRAIDRGRIVFADRQWLAGA